MKKLLILPIIALISCGKGQNYKTLSGSPEPQDTGHYIGNYVRVDTIYIHDTVYTSQHIEHVETINIDQR